MGLIKVTCQKLSEIIVSQHVDFEDIFLYNNNLEV